MFCPSLPSHDPINPSVVKPVFRTGARVGERSKPLTIAAPVAFKINDLN